MNAKVVKLVGAWIALFLVAAWVRTQARSAGLKLSTVLRPVVADGARSSDGVMEAIERAIGRERLAKCGPLAMADSKGRRVSFDVALDLEAVGPGLFAIRNPVVSSKIEGARRETLRCIQDQVEASANVVLAASPSTRRMTYSFCYGPMHGEPTDGRGPRATPAPDARTDTPSPQAPP